MTLSRLSLLSLIAIGLTLISIVFVWTEGIPHGPIFWHLLYVYDLPAAWLMLAMLVFVYWYAQRSGDGLWVERMLLTLDRQRYKVAVVLWISLCVGTIWIYQNHPLSMDEYTVLFQAKIFASGAMHGQFPPDLLDNLVPRNFQNYFLMVNRHTGAVFSAYWPGFSLLLTPFVWLGIPWACNPTLVAASFLLIGRIARDLIPSPFAAGWALLFALASPAFVANGITYYSMPAHLLFNLGFAWLLISPTPLRLFLAGLVGGFALVLHNPFPHMAFALPWIFWLATRPGLGLRNLSYLAAGYLPMALLLGAGWMLWEQQVLHAGMQAANGPHVVTAAASPVIQFIKSLLTLTGAFHWPDIMIIEERIAGLVKLWLWATPMLLLLAWLDEHDDKHPGLLLLGASALFTFFAYFIVPLDQGHGWGYRYFHSAWGTLPVLAAFGTIKLAEKEGPRVVRQIAMLALLSFVAANTMRFVQMGDFMAAELTQFPPRIEAERQIVMHNGQGYYAKDLVQNDPWLRGNEIILLVTNPKDKDRILKHFPGDYKQYSNRYGGTYATGAQK